MNRNLYARKKRQFRRLTEEVNQLQVSGQWESMDDSLKNRLVRRIRNLYQTIYGYFSRREWKRAVAMAGIVLLGTSAVQAQTFGAPLSNPFGLSVPPTQDWVMTAMVDMDQDGDLDLLGSTYEYGQAIYYQNTGSASNPQFGAPQIAPFGLTGQYTVYTAAADLDGDGDIDVLGSTYNGYSPALAYYQNNGTANNPQFGAAQVNPFGLNPGSLAALALGELTDIDGDGDYDLMAFDYYGALYYFQNTGTAQSPAFAAPVVNPFGIVPGGIELGRLNTGDFDLDGDLDIITGEYYGKFYYFENTGSPTAPAFGPRQTNPFGLSQNGYYSMVAIGDLDDDGDIDILSSITNSSYIASFNYYENNDPTIGIQEITAEVEVYPNPFADKFNIAFDSPTTGEVVIYDVSGRQVYGSNLNNEQKVELDLSGLPAGLYLVQVSTEEGLITKRVTKQ